MERLTETIIPFEGQITELDYRHSQLVHRTSPTTLKLLITFCLLLILLVMVASIITSFNLKWVFILAPVALILTYIANTPGFRFMFTSTKNYRSNKALQSQILGFVTEEGVNFTGSKIEAAIPWETYLKYKKSPSVLLLYQSEHTYNMFLEDFFENESHWNKFINFVEKNVPAS